MPRPGRRCALLVASVLVVSLMPSFAGSDTAKTGTIVLSDTKSAKATVAKVDMKTRELTLRNDQGEEYNLVAGDEVRNFHQIRKGDIVEASFTVAVASQLEIAGGTDTAGEGTVVKRAPAGAKPGLAATHIRTIIATVEDINHATRVLAARGPRGNVAIIRIPPELKAFDKLKKGDRITAVYTEALAISVKPAAKK